MGLGNHPIISDPVALNLRFEDFKNTVVINGKYTFSDIVEYLKKTQYLPKGSNHLRVRLVGVSDSPLFVPFSDPIMQLPLNEFDNIIDKMVDRLYPNHGFIYHNIYEIQ